jgi:hypothetical protein
LRVPEYSQDTKTVADFSFIRAARRSCYVKSNLAVVDDASAATTLRTLFFAAFLPADLSFRVRAAFFAAELRFVGIAFLS